ncbi:hypothetical protein AVEN_28544-1 [Araneus ventricosus]|uniref:Uncharacterized protein n=1 Tax=Araneus ventricosus TaxID=182803 RepID=A0A4Y2P5A5_ARAVE|nr:hypothetical protein AVEN_28544-1 [Araneus ventricosus]
MKTIVNLGGSVLPLRNIFNIGLETGDAVSRLDLRLDLREWSLKSKTEALMLVAENVIKSTYNILMATGVLMKNKNKLASGGLGPAPTLLSTILATWLLRGSQPPLFSVSNTA